MLHNSLSAFSPDPFRNLFLAGLFTISLLLLSTPVPAEEEAPLIFNADTLEYHDEEGVVEGMGNVHLVHKGMELKADYVRLDLNSKEFLARGNVVFLEKSQEILAGEMKYNLREETGTAGDVRTFNKPWYIRAGKFEKAGPDGYLLEDGIFTTCDLSPPHYRFTAKRIEIYPGDHLTAYHTVFRAGRIPLMYLPVCRRSLQDVPSGLIVRPGYSSEKGAFVLSHYNWYLSDKFNGRWYLDFFDKRGLGKGLDVNLAYGVEHPGSMYLYAYHIDERESPGEDRPAEERWKLHFRHRQKITKTTTGIARVDKLSDADFNDDYLDEEVLHFLSRSELEKHKLEGSLSITTNKPGYTSSIYLRKRINSFQEVTESLPRISLNLVERAVPGTSFYYDFDAKFAYLCREIAVEETEAPADGDQTDGEEAATTTEKKRIAQFDLHPELSHQTRIGWLRAKPTIGADGFLYSEDESGEENLFQGSYKFYLPLTMANGIWRIFDTGNWQEIVKVRHTVLPKLTFYYSPDPGEERENIYGFCDRIGDEEKRVKVELLNGVEGKDTSGRTHKLLAFDLYSFYDFQEEDRPWSDVVADLRVSSLRNISWRTLARFDPYIERFESLDTDLRVERDKWKFEAGTRFYEPGGEKHTFDILGKIEMPLGRKWIVDLQSRYDINREDFKVRRVTLYRDLHCWEAQLFWQSEWNGEENDTRVFVAFRIKGAGTGLTLKGVGDLF